MRYTFISKLLALAAISFHLSECFTLQSTKATVTRRVHQRSKLSKLFSSELDDTEVGNSKLRAEVEALKSQVGALTGRSPEVSAARQASFDAFDLNKDGVVDMDELRTGLYEKFGLTATDDELRRALVEFDTNQNGVLEVDEFAVGQMKMKIEKEQDDAKKAASEARRKAAENARKAEMPTIEVNNDNGLATRAASCVPYLLPLVDATPYGANLIIQSPLASTALAPLVILFKTIPFSGLIVFLFFSSQSRNPDLPKLLRFNLQQAILLDISLFIPQLFGLLPFDPALKAAIADPAGDILFVTIFAMIVYSWVWTLVTGTKADKIPLISETADRASGSDFY